jgi:hypothetical protein
MSDEVSRTKQRIGKSKLEPSFKQTEAKKSFESELRKNDYFSDTPLRCISLKRALHM